jgi:hypothetical protein
MDSDGDTIMADVCPLPSSIIIATASSTTQQAPTKATASHLIFFDLARELRDMVYDYALDMHGPFQVMHLGPWNEFLWLNSKTILPLQTYCSLCLTSKSTVSETHEQFTATTTFKLDIVLEISCEVHKLARGLLSATSLRMIKLEFVCHFNGRITCYIDVSFAANGRSANVRYRDNIQHSCASSRSDLSGLWKRRKAGHCLNTASTSRLGLEEIGV